jgi:hypothetical protein
MVGYVFPIIGPAFVIVGALLKWIAISAPHRGSEAEKPLVNLRLQEAFCRGSH